MVALPALILAAIAALAFSAQAALFEDASDISQDLVKRDNKYKLKCGNVPTVVAGEYVQQSLPRYSHENLPRELIYTYSHI